MREIFFLEPTCTHNIWGGAKLREEFGYAAEGGDIGECWGISAHPQGDGVIRGGKYDGWKLSQLWDGHPELFGGLNDGKSGETSYDRYPLLTKIIDAQDDLSIQVHPDDAYAREHENGSFGKTECWYIMDCREDATIVIGHNAGTREELRAMVEEGRWQELIREIPIRKGDFLQIDPGTVHAIKAQTLILETQQNSAITYRLYDYGRLQNGKPRELHLEKSLDVITVPARGVSDCVKSVRGLPENILHLVHRCEKYSVFWLEVDGQSAFEQKYPFLAASVLDGAGEVDGARVRKGAHFIFSGGYGKVEMSGRMSLILSTVEPCCV